MDAQALQHVESFPLASTGNLQDLARRANDAHAAVEQAARGAIQHARIAGEALLEIKAMLPHGELSRWIEANFAGSGRTARGYMLLAREWPKLENGSALPFSIRQALRLLSPLPELDEPPEPEAEDWPSDAVANANGPTNGHAEAPEPTEPEPAYLDSLCNPVPAALEPVWASMGGWREFMRLASRAADELKNLKGTLAGARVRDDAIAEFRRVVRTIRNNVAPHCPCPNMGCRGEVGNKECGACKGTGWLPKSQYILTPSELRWLDNRRTENDEECD